MSPVKKIFRKFIFPAITSLSIEKLPSLFSNNKRLILCYHGCNPDPDFNLNGRHIPLNQFERHLLYYENNFNVVSLNEMFLLYRENIIPDKKTIAITFDDGYLNNYTCIFPLLKKYDMPATFFIVSSSLIDDDYVLWPDRIDIIKTYSEHHSFAIEDMMFQKTEGTGFYSDKLGISISDHVKQMGIDRESFLRQLMLKSDFNEVIKKTEIENYKLMNVAQLKKMSECHLVEIGSHSHSHYNLGNIPHNLVQDELSKSKKIIEDVIGRKVTTIAFPDGNYNKSVKKLCHDSGYENLIAVGYQCEDDSTDKNILPRLTISNTTTYESNMIQVNLGFTKRGF